MATVRSLFSRSSASRALASLAAVIHALGGCALAEGRQLRAQRIAELRSGRSFAFDLAGEDRVVHTDTCHAPNETPPPIVSDFGIADGYGHPDSVGAQPHAKDVLDACAGVLCRPYKWGESMRPQAKRGQSQT